VEEGIVLMSPERARQVANGILTVAGVALVVVVWRQPGLRRLVRQFAPAALREIRPVHVAAALAAFAAPAAAATAATAMVEAESAPPAEPIDPVERVARAEAGEAPPPERSV
jgi:hypothetical protein